MCVDPCGHKGARPDQIPLAEATRLAAAPCGGCILVLNSLGLVLQGAKVMPLKFGNSYGGWSKGAGLFLRHIKIPIKHIGALERTLKVIRDLLCAWASPQLLSADTGLVGKGGV